MWLFLPGVHGKRMAAHMERSDRTQRRYSGWSPSHKFFATCLTYFICLSGEQRAGVPPGNTRGPPFQRAQLRSCHRRYSLSKCGVENWCGWGCSCHVSKRDNAGCWAAMEPARGHATAQVALWKAKSSGSNAFEMFRKYFDTSMCSVGSTSDWAFSSFPSLDHIGIGCDQIPVMSFMKVWVSQIEIIAWCCFNSNCALELLGSAHGTRRGTEWHVNWKFLHCCGPVEGKFWFQSVSSCFKGNVTVLFPFIPAMADDSQGAELQASWYLSHRSHPSCSLGLILWMSCLTS